MAEKDKDESCLANFTPFVVLIGLSVHSIFEGMAVGVESDDNSAAFMALAILLHKGAAGMSLAIALQKAFPTRPLFVMTYVFVFSLCTPLGTSLGMIIKN